MHNKVKGGKVWGKPSKDFLKNKVVEFAGFTLPFYHLLAIMGGALALYGILLLSHFLF